MRRVLERLLNLLAFLLTVDRPVTADEIRHTVPGYDQKSDEAFRRMFERDKDLLRRMGIPVERRPTDEWEVEWGYLIPPDEYQLPDPQLDDEERAALLLAAQVVRLGAQPTGPEAILKLGGAPFADAGEPLAADLGDDAETLSLAFQGAAEQRYLSFQYRGRQRVIAPYGLVHQHGHWYMVGATNGDVRVFRVDRASSVQVGDQPKAFSRPAEFSAKDALPDMPWEAGSDALTARIVFDPALAWWAERRLPRTAEQQRHSDGSLHVTLQVANRDAFVGWVIGFGADAEILEPADLRAELIERVKAAS